MRAQISQNLAAQETERTREIEDTVTVENPLLTPGSRQYFHPAMHPLLCSLDRRLREELLGINFVHRIDRAMEILFVAERHGGIDAHAAFETRVGRGPFLLSRGHALLWLERLSDAAWQRVDNVGVRIDPRGGAPPHPVHALVLPFPPP